MHVQLEPIILIYTFQECCCRHALIHCLQCRYILPWILSVSCTSWFISSKETSKKFMVYKAVRSGCRNSFKNIIYLLWRWCQNQHLCQSANSDHELSDGFSWRLHLLVTSSLFCGDVFPYRIIPRIFTTTYQMLQRSRKI